MKEVNGRLVPIGFIECQIEKQLVRFATRLNHLTAGGYPLATPLLLEYEIDFALNAKLAGRLVELVSPRLWVIFNNPLFSSNLIGLSNVCQLNGIEISKDEPVIFK